MTTVIIDNKEISTILTKEAYEETLKYELWELYLETEKIREGIYAI